MSQQNDSHRLSLVIPVYNEQDNIAPLVERIHAALADYTQPWELVLVDDGSTDASHACATAVARQYGNHVRVFELSRNYGQTAALQAGLDQARGDIVATLDGDMQNDPMDIPRMVTHLLARDLDMVAGWRKRRQDAALRRKLPSRVANWLIGRLTGVRLHDYGCSLKVYRASVLREVALYGQMHRFIPAWVAATTRASRIEELEVIHHPRTQGESKYGLSRILPVLVDLLSVLFFLRYRARPGHFFGMIGVGMGSLGGLILTYLAFVKFALGEDIGTRPLLLVGVMLVIASLQLVTTGVLAELLARVYFESGQRKSYVIRTQWPPGEAHADWYGKATAVAFAKSDTK